MVAVAAAAAVENAAAPDLQAARSHHETHDCSRSMLLDCPDAVAIITLKGRSLMKKSRSEPASELAQS